MAGFLYYKPHQLTPVMREDLVAWGLGYAFPKSCAPCLCQRNTPDDSAGHVFADPERMGDFGTKMDMPNQTWRRLPKRALWVGYWNKAKPTPDDLLRSPYLPGHSVKLADGQDWIIPLVRRFDTVELVTTSSLPTYMEQDDDGNWHRGPVLETHAHLWDATQPIADALLAEYVHKQPPRVNDADIFTAIEALLGANYVVSGGELSAMRALTSEANTHAAVMAACDWPSFMAWDEEIKKNEPPQPPAGLITPVGGAG